MKRMGFAIFQCMALVAFALAVTAEEGERLLSDERGEFSRRERSLTDGRRRSQGVEESVRRVRTRRDATRGREEGGESEQETEPVKMSKVRAFLEMLKQFFKSLGAKASNAFHTVRGKVFRRGRAEEPKDIDREMVHKFEEVVEKIGENITEETMEVVEDLERVVGGEGDAETLDLSEEKVSMAAQNFVEAVSDAMEE